MSLALYKRAFAMARSRKVIKVLMQKAAENIKPLNVLSSEA